MSLTSTLRVVRILLLAVTAAVAGVCRASVDTNYADQWWNPAESGWGIAIHQQADVLFVDLFVYGADGKPAWYTASIVSSTDTTSGTEAFSGELFRSTGSPFAGVFDSTQVVRERVGTLRFAPQTADTARLSYTVDGVAVSATIERQLWKRESFAGSFLGAVVYDFQTIHGPCQGGHVTETGAITIVHSEDKLTLTTQSSLRACTFSGDYSQAGHMGRSEGTFACSDGSSGSYAAYEMERSGDRMSARLMGQNFFCEFTGRVAGVLR